MAKSKSRIAIPVVLTLALAGFMPTSGYANQVVVDVTQYMTQASAGQAICTENIGECIHQFPNQYGEYEVFYAQGTNPILVDYIARSVSSGGANGGYYIGVTRSYDSYTNEGPRIRCFSNPNTSCTAPPSTSSMPEGIPKNLLLNVVSVTDDQNASASDGTPVTQIAGMISITGLNNFQVNYMNLTNCAQSNGGLVPVNVFAGFLYQADFGGDVGVKNALVVEEVEYQTVNGQLVPNHIERYYYVSYYGRVREATAVYDVSGGRYTDYVNGQLVGHNANHNLVRPVSQMPAEPSNTCPQGSKSLSD